jgi:hypothetical protein
VDPRADQDNVEKRTFLTLPGLELQSFGRPACSQSLYRLRYPGSPCSTDSVRKCIQLHPEMHFNTAVLISCNATHSHVEVG